jgi:hypothetical protein
VPNKNSDPRTSRFEKIFNDVLVAVNGCLSVVAIMLACLIVVQLEILSSQSADVPPPFSGDLVIAPM